MKKAPWLPLAVTLYLVWIVPQLIFFQDGALWGAYSNVWADWAMHLTYFNHFVKVPAAEWFSQNPIFAGEPLRYPNFVNLLSAAIHFCGGSITFSLWFVSAIGLITLVWFSRAFLTDRGMLLLFLGSSASINAGKLAYGNHLRDILFPQKGYAWGMISGLGLLLYLTGSKKTFRREGLGYFAAIAAGLLPAIHVHSLVAVVVTVFFYCVCERQKLREKWKVVAIFWIVALITWMVVHIKLPSSTFLGWQPGWIGTMEKAGLIWPIFWLVSWGAFLPLALLCFPIKEDAPPRWITYSGLSLFLLANVIRFQPWDWDNTKIFFWSYLLLIPSVVHTLGFYGKQDRRLAVVEKILFVSLLIPGTWEAINLLNVSKNRFEMFSATEIRNAKKVAELVPPTAVVLGNSDAHDFVAALAGRTVFLGYDGWLWNHGVDYYPRQLAVKSFFAAPKADPNFLTKNRIDFVVADIRQGLQFPRQENFFDTLKLIYQDETMAVYTKKKD